MPLLAFGTSREGDGGAELDGDPASPSNGRAREGEGEEGRAKWINFKFHFPASDWRNDHFLSKDK